MPTPRAAGQCWRRCARISNNVLKLAKMRGVFCQCLSCWKTLFQPKVSLSEDQILFSQNNFCRDFPSAMRLFTGGMTFLANDAFKIMLLYGAREGAVAFCRNNLVHYVSIECWQVEWGAVRSGARCLEGARLEAFKSAFVQLVQEGEGVHS